MMPWVNIVSKFHHGFPRKGQGLPYYTCGGVRQNFPYFPILRAYHPKSSLRKHYIIHSSGRLSTRNNFRISCPSLSAPKCKPENRMNQWGERLVGPNYSKRVCPPFLKFKFSKELKPAKRCTLLAQLQSSLGFSCLSRQGYRLFLHVLTERNTRI